MEKVGIISFSLKDRQSSWHSPGSVSALAWEQRTFRGAKLVARGPIVPKKFLKNPNFWWCNRGHRETHNVRKLSTKMAEAASKHLKVCALRAPTFS